MSILNVDKIQPIGSGSTVTAIANTNWTPGYLNGSISYITAS